MHYGNAPGDKGVTSEKFLARGESKKPFSTMNEKEKLGLNGVRIFQGNERKKVYLEDLYKRVFCSRKMHEIREFTADICLVEFASFFCIKYPLWKNRRLQVLKGSFNFRINVFKLGKTE